LVAVRSAPTEAMTEELVRLSAEKKDKIKEIRQELNLERKCSSTTENCLLTGCCSDPGHQCHMKSNAFGMCLTGCDPNYMMSIDKWKQPWSCEPVGTRYSPDYRADFSPAMNTALVEPWVKNCSSVGENCASTKCCSFTGYYCYEKDESWSSCLSVCNPGKENGGISDKPVTQPGKPISNPPSHANATFKVAPKGPWSCKHESVPLTPAKLTGTSLFCFTWVSNDRGKGKTDDFEILSIAQKSYTSIFACDHWVVYSDTKKTLNPGETVVVPFPKEMKRPNTKIWTNLNAFMGAWYSLKAEAVYQHYAWTVKVDPYTVFVPQRLRSILAYQPVPSNGAYLENCKHVRMGFHGSMEVVSKEAFATFLTNMDKCTTELPIKNGTHTHFRYYGEDKFMAWCMHKHGVGRIPSRQEVVTVPTGQPIYGLLVASSCPAHKLKKVADKSIQKWAPDCKLVRTAGIHEFRKAKDYEKCLADMNFVDVL